MKVGLALQTAAKWLMIAVFALAASIALVAAGLFFLFEVYIPNMERSPKGGFDRPHSVRLPDSELQLVIGRRNIPHLILGNEYEQKAFVLVDGEVVAEHEIGMDTGGYPMTQLFQLDRGVLLLVTNWRCLRIDHGDGNDRQIVRISDERGVRRLFGPAARFLGAFDEVGDRPSRTYRFISADERPHKPFSSPPPDCSPPPMR